MLNFNITMFSKNFNIQINFWRNFWLVSTQVSRALAVAYAINTFVMPLFHFPALSFITTYVGLLVVDLVLHTHSVTLYLDDDEVAEECSYTIAYSAALMCATWLLA